MTEPEDFPVHILTQADVDMIKMAMTADVDYLDYTPLYEDADDDEVLAIASRNAVRWAGALRILGDS